MTITIVVVVSITTLAVTYVIPALNETWKSFPRRPQFAGPVSGRLQVSSLPAGPPSRSTFVDLQKNLQ